MPDNPTFEECVDLAMADPDGWEVRTIYPEPGLDGDGKPHTGAGGSSLPVGDVIAAQRLRLVRGGRELANLDPREMLIDYVVTQWGELVKIEKKGKGWQRQ